MNKRVIVAGIICRGEEILLGKKTKGQLPYPDVWHILGGGVKDQERAKLLLEHQRYNDFYFCAELRREIEEEASIKIFNLRNICPDYRATPREAVTPNKNGEETHYTFLEYLCEYESGTPTPGDDIAELLWLPISKLAEIQITEPSQEMYRELGWLL